jgi:hypothetical protein
MTTAEATLPRSSVRGSLDRPADPEVSLARFGIWAGALTLAGVLLSGPVALALVHLLGAQPAWVNVETFASAYRGVQRLPYALGLLLVSGCGMMVLALARASAGDDSLRADCARLLAAVFAATILLNYVIQTTFVPAQLADPSSRGLVGAFAMTNPASLAWSLEMWGYAFAAVALWLVSGSLRRTTLERATRALIALNLLVSVLGGVLTSARQAWVFSTPGLLGFSGWNALMAVLAACFIGVWRSRLRHASAVTP